MAKKAFIVAINEYGASPAANLQFCHNDGMAWRDLLVRHFDFPSGNITLLTDRLATKRGMIDGLKQLMAGAARGHRLMFIYSGHGTYVVDRSGDELAADEAICPYGLTELLIDDEQRELYDNLAAGVRMDVLSDSCFSGTVTRAGLFDPSTETRRTRFLPPLLIDALVGREVGSGGDLPIAPGRQRRTKYPQSSMKTLLLSGCSDTQYSYETVFGGQGHGAMTYYALQTIREAGYRITYRQLRDRVVAKLKGAQFNQTPQLEGPSKWKHRQVFV